MFVSYALFSMVWAVIVAMAQPPLIAGALLVAVPMIIIGFVLRGSPPAPGAS